MFLLIPFHVDVPMRELPWMNWVLIALTILAYPLGGTEFGEQLVLGGESWFGAVGHVLAHADLFHLLGNMLFLWVFGNAVCAKVGNLVFPLVYFGLGVTSGLTCYAIEGHPLIGASGAINGIVGMFIVWYLLNQITCWYAFWFFGPSGTGTFSVSSYWIILLWLVFDIWGALRGSGGVAYTAHLAGFGAGLGVGVLLLVTGLVEMEEGERSLLQILGGDKDEPPPKVKKRPRDVRFRK
jgi:membrane associated rhomboid family serine protease